jgi:hypothetical protein
MKTEPVNWGKRNLQDAGQHRREYIQALRAADAGDIQPLMDKFNRRE